MTTPQNNYAREARRLLREGVEARQEVEERDRQRDITENGTLQENARRRLQQLADAFDALGARGIAP